MNVNKLKDNIMKKKKPMSGTKEQYLLRTFNSLEKRSPLYSGGGGRSDKETTKEKKRIHP